MRNRYIFLVFAGYILAAGLLTLAITNLGQVWLSLGAWVLAGIILIAVETFLPVWQSKPITPRIARAAYRVKFSWRPNTWLDDDPPLWNWPKSSIWHDIVLLGWEERKAKGWCDRQARLRESAHGKATNQVGLLEAQPTRGSARV